MIEKKLLMVSESRKEAFPEQNEEELKKSLAIYQKIEEFKVGDIVYSKAGMENKALPTLTIPVIIVEIFKKPVFIENEDSGSCHRFEPIDCVVGLIPTHGALTLFGHNTKRLTKTKGQ